MFSTLEGYHECTLGDTMMGVGDIISTLEDVQYTGVSIQIQLFSQLPSPTLIMISPWCTEHPQCIHDIPPLYL